MFRVLDTHHDDSTCENRSAEHARRPEPGILRWIDVIDPQPDDLTLLGERFGFHPLALEDCAHAGQRPKHEEYGDHAFVVTQGFEQQSSGAQWHELHAFIGDNYLVTVHAEPIPALDQVRSRVERDAALLQRGTDFVYYLIADGMVDANFPVLDALEDEIEHLEESVLDRPRREDLQRIFDLRRRLVHMRKILSPQRDVMALLAKHGDLRIREKTTPYFRDVYDHLVRIVESIESKRELIGNARDAYLTATSQRTNEIMKSLALLSAIFMPLTFITGFFGQNFAALPYDSRDALWAMLGTVVIAPLGMLLWFRSRRWF
jgi:magnesium transporter